MEYCSAEAAKDASATHHRRKPARSGDRLACQPVFWYGNSGSHSDFNKKKSSNNFLFIDASKHYESAKNQNKLRQSDIEKIVTTYRDFATGKLQPGVVEDKFSYVATSGEIQENDFNLNIPRYVDTFEEEAEVDIAAVQQEIEKLEEELVKVQREIDAYLNQLIS